MGVLINWAWLPNSCAHFARRSLSTPSPLLNPGCATGLGPWTITCIVVIACVEWLLASILLYWRIQKHMLLMPLLPISLVLIQVVHWNEILNFSQFSQTYPITFTSEFIIFPCTPFGRLRAILNYQLSMAVSTKADHEFWSASVSNEWLLIKVIM